MKSVVKMSCFEYFVKGQILNALGTTFGVLKNSTYILEKMFEVAVTHLFGLDTT